MKPKFAIPLSLLLVFIVSACEIPRPGGDGDITSDIPSVTTPAPTIPSGTTTPPEAVTPDTSEISPDVVQAPIAPDAQAVEPGKVLVKLTESAAVQARSAVRGSDGIMAAGIASLDQILRQIGANELEPVIKNVAEAIGEDIVPFSAEVTQVSQLYSVSFPPESNPVEVADELSQDPMVEYAEPNYIAGITAEPEYIPSVLTPNDPLFRFQWHFEAIQMPAAWDMATGQGVPVAIIDTGIDFGASDLANADRLQGYDFFNDDPDPTDDHGHGTHVAGTIAQNTNNQLGVAGIAFNARLLPIKALGANGEGSYEKIIQGLVYAVDQGAKVINLSLAGRTGSQALGEAVQYAHDRGVIVVAAAGNSGAAVEYPAAYDEFVIAVGATDFNNRLTAYSNFGAQIDFVAPGGDVTVDNNQDGWADGVLQQTFKSTGPGTGYSYRFFEGTSMASPHVAGVAALLLSSKPNASPAEIEDVLARTARNIGPSNQYGAGLIQAADALAAIGGPPPANQSPLANAGANQTVVDSDGNGTEDVSLDGSASSDPDGTIVSFEWREGGTRLATIVNPLVSLAVGTHTIELVVTDNNGATASASAIITVNPQSSPTNQSPLANAGADQTVVDSDGNGTEDVSLDGSASSDPDGNIVSFEWREGSALVARDVNPLVSLAVGTHTIDLTVTDDGGAMATDSVIITVNPQSQPPAAGELLVNGSFENDDVWVFGDTPIRGGYETDIVRDGSRSARVGATTGRDRFSFSSVWQRVTIPTEAREVTLSAYVYPISQDVTGRDAQNIAILDERFRILTTLSSQLSDSQTWEFQSYDLSHLRGQTIFIYFSVFNRGRTGKLSAMYVDDVSLTWSP